MSISALPGRVWRVATTLLTPVDLSTDAGRAHERQRRLLLAALASALARAISICASLVTVPLTLHYLGVERYGMWMVMSSFIAVLGFTDLGIGNGVLTLVSRLSGKDDVAGIRDVVSSAFAILTLIAVCLGIAFAISYNFVGWYHIFNVDTAQARAEAGPALATFVACFLVSIPISIVQRVQTGLQQGFIVSLWQAGGSLLSLCAILLVIHLEGGLPWLVLALVGTPQLAVIANNLTFFGLRRPDLCPMPSRAQRHVMGQVAHTGLLFLVLQLVVAVTYSSDSLIIAQMLGASAVADYAVPERMFVAVSAVLSMITAPLWPAFGEALARGDRAWVRRIMKLSVLVNAGLATGASLVLVLFGPRLIALWVGHAVSPPLLLLIGFGVWKICEAVGGPIAVLLNGAHVVRPQIVFSSVMAVVAITLKVLLISQIGVAGAIWATSIAFVLCALIPLSLIARKVLRS